MIKKSLELVDEKTLFNIDYDKNTLHLAENFNKEHCITAKTRLVIIGTITPPAGQGYFYTAPRNLIYGHIDEALGQTTLKDLKNELKNSNNKEKIIQKIKKELISKGIAFLDIMKYVIRDKKRPDDKLIKYYTLDTESFKAIPETACIICNSRLAETGYNQICNILGKTPNYVYLGQRGTKKDKWLEYLKKVLIHN